MTSIKTSSEPPPGRSGLLGRLLAMVGLVAALAGCATGPGVNPKDPFEPFNRSVSKFNEDLDRALLKPVATVYRDVTPDPIRHGVTNFFGNLRDAWSSINSLLQLKPEAAIDNFMRFTVNSFFGLGGILDVASEMNIDRHPEDFGQTLGRWGIPSGPYLVLPGLGSSTVRDTLAIGVEYSARADLVRTTRDVAARNSLYVLRVVNGRSTVLNAGELIGNAALDKYTFTRDAYLQIRRNQINDGKDPDDDKEDPDDGKPAPAAK